MVDDKSDPHKNNMGFAPGTEQDYGAWDWRKIKVAVVGSVNTDLQTAANKLPGTSNPESLKFAGDAFYWTQNNLQLVHDGLKYWHDYLVGFDKPVWTGDAADAFRNLMNKTIASVKGHLAPLTADPPYHQSLYDAAENLTTAINTVNQQDYDAAQRVINRYNGTPDDQINHGGPHSGGVTKHQKGPPPWYTYNGTTIVMISRYPDIDQQLSVDMRKTLNTLVEQYRGHSTSMPPPAPLPSPDPGVPNGGGDQKPPKIEFGKPPPITFGDPPKQKTPKVDPPPKLNDPNLKGGPDAPKLGPDAPKVGPNGELLGPDGKPLTGPNGEPLGPDGTPLTDPNLQQPDLVNTPQGPAVVGPDGKTLLDPKTGKPLIDPKTGKPLTVDDLPKTGVIPPGGGPTTAIGKGPPSSKLKTPGLNEPSLAEPPNLRNLTSGGPPKSPAELQSEGALKSGAKEFGEPEGAFGGARGGAAGEGGRGGEPMPMGGGMGGAGAGEKDRDRTTWLVEDEEIWGAETTLGAGVLGR